ncbi:TIGR04282 family arsenosugar biosynthesis glycosyltransferase [Actinophytocola sp.]|uniref:TIGR04282 family arsenosugar biosynthesis glycosyltransferase n=1 Tax=Actinophytocola sp. TaxID=1872138 RepID=UPI003D6A699B
MKACLLVVAKAPVAGLAKTRLGRVVGDRAGARIAAAALLDTLDAVRATPGTIPVVAMTGRVDAAERSDELAEALSRCTVIPQRGTGLGDRLANAHLDVAAGFAGVPVFQIGMDTPQLRPEILTAALAALDDDDTDAVLGPATDGGWWGLGLRSPDAATVLRSVPMSRGDTGMRTLLGLRGAGLRVCQLLTLSDVDTVPVALRVAGMVPGSRFADAVASLKLAGAAR